MEHDRNTPPGPKKARQEKAHSEATKAAVATVAPYAFNRAAEILMEGLRKTAAPVVSTDLGEIKKTLKVGDVVLTTGGKPSGLFGRAFTAVYRPAARAVTGDYGHAVLYLGGGKVLNTVPGRGAAVMPLEDAVARQDAKVIRPTAALSQRRQAVAVAKSMEGAKYDAGIRRFYRILFDQKHSPTDAEVKDLKDGLYCSNMITRAYKGVKFAPGKSPEYLRPKDLNDSPYTTDVALWRNPARWDPHARKPIKQYLKPETGVPKTAGLPRYLRDMYRARVAATAVNPKSVAAAQKWTQAFPTSVVRAPGAAPDINARLLAHLAGKSGAPGAPSLVGQVARGATKMERRARPVVPNAAQSYADFIQQWRSAPPPTFRQRVMEFIKDPLGDTQYPRGVKRGTPPPGGWDEVEDRWASNTHVMSRG